MHPFTFLDLESENIKGETIKYTRISPMEQRKKHKQKQQSTRKMVLVGLCKEKYQFLTGCMVNESKSLALSSSR